MPEPSNVMEIFKYLEKSNCRECGEKTCLAFAGAVFQGRKTIDQCPRLPAEVTALFARDDDDTEQGADERQVAFLKKMATEIGRLDLSEAAARAGGRFDGDKLTLKVLGKDFSVNAEMKFITQLHVNPWILGPFLDYVIYGDGVIPNGSWVSYRELAEGKERYPLFQKRCEAALKRIADTYTDLFDDLVHIFDGKRVAEAFESDISVVLHPLPKVPIMICYWRPEEGMASDMNLFFDRSADRNLKNGTAFTLGAGLAQMFEKLAVRHGVFENV
ncbi:MAG: DUF3786 domain-containing protein [Deltaproteobacteria bacterium]|nr:DUF3786 domain-containing protein [Deltaproteobacteria bacterium]